jgi:CRISPR-associated protein Cas1
LGRAPGLGFVHTGHERAFVYDIADLYKAEITIPIAFDVAASDSTDIGADTRRAVRDRVHDGAILARCVRDIRTLLLQPQPSGAIDDDDLEDQDSLGLWDDSGFEVAAGRNYSDIGDVDF